MKWTLVQVCHNKGALLVLDVLSHSQSELIILGNVVLPVLDFRFNKMKNFEMNPAVVAWR